MLKTPFTRSLRALALALGLTLAAPLLGISAQAAATLPVETAARLAPSPEAAVLRVLPAGSTLRAAPEPSPVSANLGDDEPTTAARQIKGSKTHWQAITLDGPFTLYVRNGDIDKGLAIKPDSPLYLAPDLAATVVTYAAEGDAITITGLHGRWTQIELDKPLTAYVANVPTLAQAATPAARTATASATAPAEAASSTPESGPPEAAPATVATPASPIQTAEAAAVVPSESVATAAAQGAAPADAAPLEIAETVVADAPVANRAAPSQSRLASSAPAPAHKPGLTRNLLQGKLVRTRRFFSAQRGYAYDWQLNAKFNFRVAYLDFSRMQGTEQLARFAGQQVAVYGIVSPLGDGQYVMEVESIRLQ